MKPAPKLKGGRWVLDLRWAGFGQYTLTTPGERHCEGEAIHEAYARYLQLRDAAGALTSQSSFAFEGGPLLREAIRLHWQGREAERMSSENRRYVRGYLDHVERRLGHLKVAAFAPPHGDSLLIEFRNDLADEGMRPKTRRNYLNTVMQVLRFSHKRGWLPSLPVKPVPTVGAEVVNDPEFRWYTETDFRALRDALYADHDHPGDLSRWYPDRAERLAYIARRRLYLSVAFYTGMHTADLDRLCDQSIDYNFRTFLRVNSKSARCVPKRRFEAPEQLLADAADELERVGRHWSPGEPIAGGAWPQVTRVLQSTARQAGLPRPVNLRILRRSTAYHLCLLGWPEEEVAEYLGHVDRTMLGEVYRRVPLGLRSKHGRLDWTVENMAKVTGGLTARARVLDFSKALKEGERHGPQRGASVPAIGKRRRGPGDVG